MIAAIGKNRELGYNNQLLWHLKGDMKFFRDNTMGKIIVMGKNTFLSLPGLLPNRKHVVLTHGDIDNDEVLVFNTFNNLVDYINSLSEEVMIIGGASIYNSFMPLANKLILTEIDDKKDADVYFPFISCNEWDRKVLQENKENDINYNFVSYTRKLKR